MLQPTGRTTVTLADEVYTFDETELTLDDLFRIKSASGLALKPLMQGINEGDPTALQALVWFCRLQAGRPEDIRTVDFRLADLKLEPVLEEAPDPTEDATSSEPAATDTSDSSPISAT